MTRLMTAAACFLTLHSMAWATQEPAPGPVIRYAFNEGAGGSAAGTGPLAVPLNLGQTGVDWSLDVAPGQPAGSASLSLTGGTLEPSNRFAVNGIANTFSYTFWAKPSRTRVHIAPSLTTSGDPVGQRSVFAHDAGGPSVSVGTNGVTVLSYSSSTFQYQSIASEAADLSSWSHVAVVFESRVPRIYVNGMERTSAPRLAAPVGSLHPALLLGNEIDPPGLGAYEGLLDDVRIYDRALSGDDIRMLAGTTVNPNPGNPGPGPSEEGRDSGTGGGCGSMAAGSAGWMILAAIAAALPGPRRA